MLTLYHAPNSRSTSVLSLLKEMGVEDRVEVRPVSIRRLDGSGAPDPANPHPEGKVPCLQDGDEIVHERGAVMLYLTDRFPEAGLGPQPGEPGRGAYLSWLFHSHAVVEPLLMLRFAGVEHPVIAYQWRDLDTLHAAIDAALAKGPWLLGERFSAADLLIAGLYTYARLEAPQPRVQNWVARCAARPAERAAWAEDGALAEPAPPAA